MLELDELGEPRNGQVQDILRARTGCRTVPQVFVAGEFHGGGDDMLRMRRDGSLMRVLQNAGCTFTT